MAPEYIAIGFAAFNAAITVGGGIFFWGRVVQRLDEHGEARKQLSLKLDNLLTSFQTAAIDTAKFEGRLDRAESDITRHDNVIENLRRGHGYMIGGREFPGQ